MAATAAQVRAEDQFRYNTPFWAGGCIKVNGQWQWPRPGDFDGVAKILDKRKQLVKVVPHPWQLEFDDLLERQRAEGKPMRAIVLKARKLGFCCSPETRVLTADLRWLTLDEIRPGQRIVAVDEEKPGGRGHTRKFRVGMVEAKREVREEAFRIRFDDGRSVIATGPHRWLCLRRGGTDADWRTVERMRVGDYVRHVTTPWESGTLEDGWMGGFIDGEGCLARKRAGGGELAISQRPSPALDRARDYLRHRGYAFREEVDDRHAQTNGRHQDNAKLLIGRTNELFRLIGQSRSTRFASETGWWADRALPGKRSGVAWARVTAIESLGVQRMIDLQTDRKTFIAEGFVSHNSTWVALKFIQRLTMIEYQQAMIVAQDVDTASQIFQMGRLCHAHLPTMDELEIGFSVHPAIVKQKFSADGRKFLEFGEASKRLRDAGRTGSSVLEIDTANSGESGRGYTMSMLHLSEVARWRGDAATLKMTGMLNALPPEPETICVLESTANGQNHFYHRWISARDGAGDPFSGETYAPLFVPWWRDERAAELFADEELRERFIATIGRTDLYGEPVEDEPMLVELYGCTPEQLMWRRQMIRTQHKDNVELFNQENPHSDESAFLGSGRTFYGGVLISRTLKATEAEKPPVKGSLVGANLVERRTRSNVIQVPTQALWTPASEMRHGQPELSVWEHPLLRDEMPPETPPEELIDGVYVIAVDIAMGEAQTIATGDWTVATVFEHRKREQVAVHASKMDAHLVPDWLFLLGLYYNTALLAVEINGPGFMVVDKLQKSLHYPRLYRRRTFDHVANKTLDRVGWETNGKTKQMMEGTFGAALQSETHGLRDVQTARELSTYVIDEKGKHGAVYGEHDDRLIAAMIAHQVMDVMRPPRPHQSPPSLRLPADPITGY